MSLLKASPWALHVSCVPPRVLSKLSHVTRRCDSCPNVGQGTGVLKAATNQLSSCCILQSMITKERMAATCTGGHSVSADSCGIEAAVQALAPPLLCLQADAWLSCCRPRMPGSA